MNEIQELKEANNMPLELSKEVLFKADTEMKHFDNYITSAKNAGQLQQVVNNNLEFSRQKVMELSNLGLSISNGDYYVVSYGGKPTFPIDYKGMLKILSIEARKAGFQLLVKADTIRKGFSVLEVETDGFNDNLKLVNGKINAEVLTAYCMIGLIDMKTHEKVLTKVEVLPIGEYQNAKNASKGGSIYKMYESEMAKKIALRRATKVLSTMFYSSAIDKLLQIDNEDYDLNNSQSPKPQHSKQNDSLGLGEFSNDYQIPHSRKTGEITRGDQIPLSEEELQQNNIPVINIDEEI